MHLLVSVKQLLGNVLDAVCILESQVELVVLRHVVVTILSIAQTLRQLSTRLAAVTKHVDLNVLAQLFGVFEPVVLNVVAIRDDPGDFSAFLRRVVRDSS